MTPPPSFGVASLRLVRVRFKVRVRVVVRVRVRVRGADDASPFFRSSVAAVG